MAERNYDERQTEAVDACRLRLRGAARRVDVALENIGSDSAQDAIKDAIALLIDALQINTHISHDEV